MPGDASNLDASGEGPSPDMSGDPGASYQSALVDLVCHPILRLTNTGGWDGTHFCVKCPPGATPSHSRYFARVVGNQQVRGPTRVRYRFSIHPFPFRYDIPPRRHPQSGKGLISLSVRIPIIPHPLASGGPVPLTHKCVSFA